MLVGVSVALLVSLGSNARDDGLLGEHGISIFGEPKYAADFEHFAYADPNAVKGGQVTLSAIGTYDTLNPFTLKGTPAAGAGLIYDTLLIASLDEPFSEYGLVAESIDMPADRSWVAFTLREGARWHDGQSITVDDVMWTAETLTTKGHPFYRHYYGGRYRRFADGTAHRPVRFR